MTWLLPSGAGGPGGQASGLGPFHSPSVWGSVQLCGSVHQTVTQCDHAWHGAAGRTNEVLSFCPEFRSGRVACVRVRRRGGAQEEGRQKKVRGRLSGSWEGCLEEVTQE